MSAPQGNFAWYELMTTDTAAAGAFYASVVGWTSTDVGSPEMPYITFNVGERGIAGLMTLPKDAGPKPAWIGYIHVDDVDGYVAKLVEAGGQMHRPPVDVPGMLRFSVVVDPQGAPFVLFTGNPSMPTPPPLAPNSVGTIGWRELLATDAAAAFEFYSSQFGWTRGHAHDMGPMGTYQTFNVDGVENGGMMTAPPGMPGSSWVFYFQVDSLGAAIERLKAGGGAVMNGPHQVPGNLWVVVAADPQGASFALVSTVE